MSKTLTEIAELLKASDKKVQLIYAFNGIGKTRLSRNFRLLIDPKNDSATEERTDFSSSKVLYYNAFTEDLFYWNNDLEEDKEHILNIQPNSFTDRLLSYLQAQGLDGVIVNRFQQYSSPNVTPYFNADFSNVTFSLERGGDDSLHNMKISKGEESSLVWSVFYSLIEQAINIRNVVEVSDRETEQFNQLDYIFIDDPVSSLDDNHLIELAVNLAELIKSSDFTNGVGIKFIISTHNPLFYNVLHNELGLSKKGKKEGCYLLERFDDGMFNLNIKYGDSNKSFSYHLYLRQLLEVAIAENTVERYHFTLLRNLYEKTASFLGYREWSELLPGERTVYLNRIIQFTSHSSLSNETVSQPSEPEKKTVGLLLNHLIENYGYWKQDEAHEE
jgi:wobble nucleotide-excising tRNase